MEKRCETIRLVVLVRRGRCCVPIYLGHFIRRIQVPTTFVFAYHLKESNEINGGEGGVKGISERDEKLWGERRFLK